MNRTLRAVLLAATALIVFLAFILGLSIIAAMVLDGIDERLVLAVFILLGAASLVHTFVTDHKDKSSAIRQKIQYLELGRILFKSCSNDFETYYKEHLNSGNQTSRPIDVLVAFAETKELAFIVDWRGEENEGEIEDFVTSSVEGPVAFSATHALRKRNPDVATRDGKFIIRLFKALDSDLEHGGHRLIFFNTEGDSYALMVSDAETHDTIMNTKGVDIHGAEKL